MGVQEEWDRHQQIHAARKVDLQRRKRQWWIRLVERRRQEYVGAVWKVFDCILSSLASETETTTRDSLQTSSSSRHHHHHPNIFEDEEEEVVEFASATYRGVLSGKNDDNSDKPEDHFPRSLARQAGLI